jgi:hypothetical protein
MPIDLGAIFKELEAQVVNLAKSTVSQYADAAVADGKQLLQDMKDDLARWTQELADGKITTSDFEVLVLSQKDLIEMHGLTQAGLALARIDAFKSSVFNLIIDTVFNLVKV